MSPPVRFLGRASAEGSDPGTSESVPHPREMLSLLGHAGAEQAFLAAHASGKLHHAWLLAGPEGVGKATFAYRAARFLLSEPERAGEAAGALFAPAPPVDLSVAEASRTAALVAHAAHPDLAVLERRFDAKTKKFRQEIAVEDTRAALTLFEKTAALGGWRVIIVDCADDLNASSANALLKTLEEPPDRAVFFIVAHQPARLLATIRSRCRRLSFEPLGAGDVAALLAAFGRPADPAIIGRAEGSMRQALRLSEPAAANFQALLDQALARLPERQPREIDRLAEATRGGGEGATYFADFCAGVETWLAARLSARLAAGQGARATAPLAEAWAKLADDRARIEAYNLDRRAYVISLFDDLAALASSARG